MHAINLPLLSEPETDNVRPHFEAREQRVPKEKVFVKSLILEIDVYGDKIIRRARTFQHAYNLGGFNEWRILHWPDSETGRYNPESWQWEELS